MPTELEELVEFLHHGNPQIRQIAISKLAEYSLSQPEIFKVAQMRPIKDLKLLVKDYAPIAHDTLTILINLCADQAILQDLSVDDDFLEALLLQITNTKEPNADLIAMLLANMAKSTSFKRILFLTRTNPPAGSSASVSADLSLLSDSKNAMDQLMDCFVKGAEGAYNPQANYDHLAYLFADLAQYPEGRDYLVTAQPYDSIIPITKLVVFTEHKSLVRRKGVASTIKNTTFSLPSHPLLLDPSCANILPYILLPLAGAEEYPEEESSLFPTDLQLLPPDKRRETDPSILTTHIETLLLLTTAREGRETLRQAGVYPLVREMHAAVVDEEVREACERFVGVLMRDEGIVGDGGWGEGEGRQRKGKVVDDDDDERGIVEVL
ncbi:MAG: hypothetical protein M1816_000418 [Peltula sp. TS41687]|nr:MAG: hypothetical protein M1816_000418 [Peltula sp. TS41687]